MGRMRGARILALGALAACAQARARSDGGPAAGAGVLRDGDALTITFPAVPAAVAGCGEVDSARHTRSFSWNASVNLDAGSGGSHRFVTTGVYFELPDSSALDEARLGRVLVAQAVTVDEAAGEPPLMARRWHPRRASARLVHGRVVVTLEGADAVDAFMASRPERALLVWCRRDQSFPTLEVAVRSIR